MLKRTLIPPLILLLLVIVGGPPSRAQDEPPPPVGRLSVMDGDVSILRGDETNGWVSAAVNTPLLAGDSLYASYDSRAEVELDHNNILRLASQTQAKILNLTSDQIQVEVAQGLVDFVVLRDNGLGEGDTLEPYVEIATPNVAVRPLLPGVYRIQVDSDSLVYVTVRKGRAEVFTPEGSTTVERGQMITVQGTDSPEYQMAEADPTDEWDHWNTDRDRDILNAQSWQYANSYYTGASDLDQYGQWVEVPGYNWCWTPNVNAGWVPYASGHWVWEPYWGWTWVSNEPWGWAPYHYGRWFFYGNHWVWWPGPPVPGYQPVYAPAYVNFLGFDFGGSNWSYGYGYGFQTIGWVPAGPSDYCYPWWGYPNTYQATNITNATGVIHVRRIYSVSSPSHAGLAPLATANQPVQSNFQNLTTNERVHQAIITVSAERFGRGEVPRQLKPVDLAALGGAQLVSGTLPVVPTRESLRPKVDSTKQAAVPANAGSRPRFYSKIPAPAALHAFDQDVAEIKQMVRQRQPAPAANRASSASVSTSSPSAVTGGRVEAPGFIRLQGAKPTSAASSAPLRSEPGSSTLERAVQQPKAAFPEGAASHVSSGADDSARQAKSESSEPESTGPPVITGESTAVQGAGQTAPEPAWKRFSQPAPAEPSRGHYFGAPATQGSSGDREPQPGAQPGQRFVFASPAKPAPAPATEGGAAGGENSKAVRGTEAPARQAGAVNPPSEHHSVEGQSHPQERSAPPAESHSEKSTSPSDSSPKKN